MEQKELLEVQNELKNNVIDISERLEKAQETETPYIVDNGKELNVVGNANEIEVKPKDYTLVFKFPAYQAEKIGGKIVGGSCYKEIEFKDVYPDPKREIARVQKLLVLIPFFRKVSDGKVETPTKEELQEIVMSFTDEIVQALYDFVADLLGVDDSLKDSMSAMGVLEVFMKVLNDFPELFAEADGFFEELSLTPQTKATETNE